MPDFRRSNLPTTTIRFPDKGRPTACIFFDKPAKRTTPSCPKPRRSATNFRVQPIVFGFDNTRMAGEISPTLSSVGADCCTLGQKAVEVLLDKMNGRRFNSAFKNELVNFA